MSVSEDTPLPAVRPFAGDTSLSREQVDDIQRVRILSAMVEVAADAGYLGAAVAPVVGRAGVSRRTFYELFEGREDCFLAAFEWSVTQARQVVVEGYRSRGSWRDRMRRALAELLAFLDVEPELARVCVIEALGAGKLVLECRARVLDELIAALDASAPRARRANQLPLLTAEGVVGGAFSVLHGQLLEQQAASARTATVSTPRTLTELHGQLMALIALPYLGPQVAGEELTRQAPEVRRGDDARTTGDGGRLLERLDMRLTYRTVRCLLFIGKYPGSSNREIARGAEVPDEGQASKLLGRLTRLGLIANTKAHGPGHPNYWTLTTHGQRVLNAVQDR